MTWTQFWDMHSGGGTKEEPYEMIYIEAPEAEARVIFYNRFGHGADRVSCTCCGEDYVVSDSFSLAQLTGFHRGCRCLETPRDPKTGLYMNDDPVIKAHLYLELGESPPDGYKVSDRPPIFGNKYMTLDEYLAKPNVLVVRAADITKKERKGKVPASGYVWIE